MTVQSDSRLFYQNLPASSSFSDLAEGSLYQPFPDDWWVIISDVKDSTLAITEGKYRDVNTMGAAGLVAIQKVLDGLEIPFSFGGDGITLVVPQELKETVVEEMLAVRHIAEVNYNLNLRVGAVPIHDIRVEGGDVQVAKYQLVPKKNIAFFQGGGIALADAWIKEGKREYSITKKTDRFPDLSALSCRWQPISAQKGNVLSVIVVSRDSEKLSYQKILHNIENHLETNMDDANPVRFPGIQFSDYGYMLKNEKRMHRSKWSLSWWIRFMTISMAFMMFRKGIYRIMPFVKRYLQQNPTHSDYRKLDDALRFVIDCSDDEFLSLNKWLEQKRAEGLLYFGVHSSNEALMTCIVNGMSQGQHIHFIDGGDGGYAMAARQLKEQMIQSK